MEQVYFFLKTTAHSYFRIKHVIFFSNLVIALTLSYVM